MMNLSRKETVLQQSEPVRALELRRKQHRPLPGAKQGRIQARKSMRDSHPGVVIGCNGP
jgi:hypothetical protein